MEWKTINDFEDYEISNDGSVRSKGLLVGRGSGFFKMKDRILKPRTDKDGYLNIGLHKGGKPFYFKVHRLAAKAFILNPENKEEINHINGIKNDNRIENLEWCNKEENQSHAFNKLKIKNKPVVIKQYSLSGKLIGVYESEISAAKRLKLSAGNISKAARSKNKTYKSFIWEIS